MQANRQGTVTMAVMLLVVWLAGCQQVNPDYQEEAADPAYMHGAMQQLTDVIVHDIFSPPVASRIYAYPSIAAYEIMAQQDPAYRSLSGQLNELSPLPFPDQDEKYCYPLAAVQAFLEVGKALTFSEPLMEEYQEKLLQEYQSIEMPRRVYRRSVAYGEEVAAHILDWAATDQYKQTRTYPKFTINDEEGRWQPTPPDYMDGIEPHWRDIRPLVLDSAQQFVPPPPTPYNMDKNSQFYAELMEVYRAMEAPDKDEREAIARFWDCNPYVSHHAGHVMYATKKITPGGHWIGIAKIAGQQAGLDFVRTAELYAMTSIVLFDAFISCWDEKYRSNLIRPETVINEHIDQSWRPVLQTPPFPEYTSGHSVISRAAAVTLTNLLGDDFAFEDTTEERYGLPARSYRSFLHASEEAAISRLYGGIHYRPAIEYGIEQGDQVGNYVIQQLQTREQLTSQ